MLGNGVSGNNGGSLKAQPYSTIDLSIHMNRTRVIHPFRCNPAILECAILMLV